MATNKKRSTKASKRSPSLAFIFGKPWVLFALIFAVLGTVTVFVSHADRAPSGPCTFNEPYASIDTRYSSSVFSPGAGMFAQPGVPVGFDYSVSSHDLYCPAGNFTVKLSGDPHLSISPASTTVSLSYPTNYQAKLHSVVTVAPGTPAGDYNIYVIAVNDNDQTKTAIEYGTVKVYTSDTAAPTVTTMKPDNGTSVSGAVSLEAYVNDDHGPAKKVEAYVDGALVNSVDCTSANTSVTYCNLIYSWSGTAGTHTATFKAYDQSGNVGTGQTSFTITAGGSKAKRH